MVAPELTSESSGHRPLRPPVTSDARGVLVSAGSQMVAKVVHLGVNVVSSLAIIHHLGPAGYGEYVLVVTVAGLTGLIGDFGLNKLAVRKIAVDADSEPAVLGSLVTARLGLSVLSVAAAQVVLVAIGASAEIRLAGFVLSTLAFVEAAFGIFVVFHVRLIQQYEALVRVVAEILETALVLLLIVLGAGLVPLVTAPVVAALLGVGGAVILVRRETGWVPRPSTGFVGGLLREGLFVGPALIIAAAYLRVPGLLLAWLSTAEEVGVYGAAYQPIEYLLLAAAVLIHVLLPLLARSHSADHARFVALYRRGTEGLLAVTVPLAIVAISLAPWLVDTAFGAEYAAATTPLRILSAALVLMVLSFWMSYVLLAAELQRITLAYDVAALVTAVSLCALLIPSHGGAGAAVAIGGACLLTVVWAVVAASKGADATLDPGRLGRVALSAAVMAGTVVVGQAIGLPSGVAVVASCAVYAVAIVRTGIADLNALRAAAGDPGSHRPAPIERAR